MTSYPLSLTVLTADAICSIVEKYKEDVKVTLKEVHLFRWKYGGLLAMLVEREMRC